MKTISRIKKLIINEFDLREGKADNVVIDEVIHQGATIRGPVAWVLIFAIVIASVGLNINSIAVIIGAMLISPLMGPIIGIGYGIGVFDFKLLRQSLSNLILTAFISIFVSALYFWITPLSSVQSVFLERTMPTIWDVIIAFCGGMVGIIGLTRKEKSTIIPGVAIATALMPPLCTAGYELTRYDGALFAGALYLFTINCVYIAFSTSIVVWLMKIPRRQFVKRSVEKRVKHSVFVLAFLTMLPSIYIAIDLVREELFTNYARRFIMKEFNFPKTYIVDMNFLPKNKEIEITLIGEPLKSNDIENINKHLKDAELGDASIIIHQADDEDFQNTWLEKELRQNKFYQNTLQELNEIKKELNQLKMDIKKTVSAREPLS